MTAPRVSVAKGRYKVRILVDDKPVGPWWYQGEAVQAFARMLDTDPLELKVFLAAWNGRQP